MRHFNIFYITVFLLGALLLYLLQPGFHQDLSFYGFAESNETEINYNYPVVVDQILVKSGQAVKAGDVLMHLSRRKSKERLDDQNYRIAELNADENVWRQKKGSELSEIQLEKRRKLATLDTEILQLEKELDFKKSLSRNLQTLNPSASAYRPLEERLKALRAEKSNQEEAYELSIRGLKQELNLGESPYREQIKRLKAEQAFELSQQHLPIIVTAPMDGLVGNINCKEEEHIPSYSTLLSFYEPHSGIVKGYVHEDLTLKVQLGDQYVARSLKNKDIQYDGKVIGLGSRIVEIPARLRKIPDFKSYGREVLVEITKDNSFLQKEKVSLQFISSNH